MSAEAAITTHDMIFFIPEVIIERSVFKIYMNIPCVHSTETRSMYETVKNMPYADIIMCRYFFNNKMYSTICFASSSDTFGCGVIGISPQTPEPPSITFFASVAIVASSAPAYLLATSR